MLAIVIYGVYNTLTHRKSHIPGEEEPCEACLLEQRQTHQLQEELSLLSTPEYTLRYIEGVIARGSNTLGFKGGVMEGGLAGGEDAKKIACYVLELSGRKCPHPYPQDAAMFFTSLCGGCHGNDGRGLGGNYPDLTRKKLLGIERKEAYLKEQINRLKNQRYID